MHTPWLRDGWSKNINISHAVNINVVVSELLTQITIIVKYILVVEK